MTMSPSEERKELGSAELLRADLLERCAAENSGNYQVLSWSIYVSLILYMLLVESIQTLLTMHESPFQIAFCCVEAILSSSLEPLAASFEEWFKNAFHGEDVQHQCVCTLLL
jgi:hypothetical protein